MSTAAALGSTGNTGSCVVRNLLDHSRQNKVNSYSRNKAKLLRVTPEVAENKRVNLFEGSIEDGPIQSCWNRYFEAPRLFSWQSPAMTTSPAAVSTRTPSYLPSGLCTDYATRWALLAKPTR